MSAETRAETRTVTAPAYWANYLINGDDSDLDGYGEKYMVDQWIDTLAKDGWEVVSCEGEAFFAHTHDASRFAYLGDDVLTYVLRRCR